MTMQTHATIGNLMKPLFTEYDPFTRSHVEEILRRKEEYLKPLSELASTETFWENQQALKYAPLHAVYLLGAFGGEEVVRPLLRAAEWMDKHHRTYLWGIWPSIIGTLPPAIREELKTIAVDPGRSFLFRCAAMEGLAALTIRNPELEDEVFGFLGDILKQESNREIRESTAWILVDFLREEHMEALIRFGKENEPHPESSLDDVTVTEMFRFQESYKENYDLDWLVFYDPEAIEERRQMRKEDEERAWRAKFRVGRNAPCPCGSEKKFKKCCLDRVMH